MNRERFETLMVTVVDGTASPADREELMAWVIEHPEARQEFDAHTALKAVTDGWVQRLEVDLVSDEVAARASTRIPHAIGFTLVAIATAVLVGGGVYALLTDPEVPIWVSVGMAAGIAGAVILLLSVIRTRLLTRSSDRYSEVIR